MKNQVKKIHANQAYQLYYHGMMLPGFIFLILFNFVPMFGVIMAFQDRLDAALGFIILQTRQRVFRL